jgi:phosphoribosylanthranilate isomerase
VKNMKKTLAKICGISTVEAALCAAENGADLIGLVFYPSSPRFVSFEQAQQIIEAVRNLPEASQPKIVGLYVNTRVKEMVVTAATLCLDYLQLSGDETPEVCHELVQMRPVLKAVRLPLGSSPHEALKLVAPFASIENLTLLLDTPKQGSYGGTGEVGDWQAAQAVCQQFSAFLAGGLTPENVAEAIRLVQPHGVDVSSGVEVAAQPGVKDLAKIKKFLAEVRATEQVA